MPKFLYHYTSEDSYNKIKEHNLLRFSNPLSLDVAKNSDKEEFSIGFKRLISELIKLPYYHNLDSNSNLAKFIKILKNQQNCIKKYFDEKIKSIVDDFYLLSTSKTSNNLYLKNNYCTKNNRPGYIIKIDYEKLIKNEKDIFYGNDVLYFQDFNANSKLFLNLVTAIIDKIYNEIEDTRFALHKYDENISLCNNDIICKILIWIQLFIKTNKDTVDENEFRIVVNMKQTRLLRHFSYIAYSRLINLILNEMQYCYFIPSELIIGNKKVIKERFILVRYDKSIVNYINNMCQRLIGEK